MVWTPIDKRARANRKGGLKGGPLNSRASLERFEVQEARNTKNIKALQAMRVAGTERAAREKRGVVRTTELSLRSGRAPTERPTERKRR
jgi:hypothetical protein